MAQLVIPETVQVVASGGAVGSETWTNVLHLDRGGTGVITALDASDIAFAFDNYFADVQVRRHSSWSYDRLTVRDIGIAGNPTHEFNPTPVVGDDAGSLLPPQTSLVVSLLTGHNSRSGRGRVYLNGFDHIVASPGDGQMSAVNVQAELDDFVALCDALVVLGFPLAVASRTELLNRPVQQVRINSVWDTQRRRSRDLEPISSLTGSVTFP